MRSKGVWLPIVLSVVLVLFLALLIKAAGHTRPARAATEFTVCPSGLCDFVSIQDAVDAAKDGDTIKVAAFTYHAVTARTRDDVKTTGLVTQVVYITKSITLRGGYATGFPEPPDPVASGHPEQAPVGPEEAGGAADGRGALPGAHGSPPPASATGASGGGP